VDSSAKAIAWPTDTQGRFKNLDPEGTAPGVSQENQVAQNMWVLRTFPPVACEQQVFTNESGFVPAHVAMRKVSANSSGQDKSMELVDCRGYMTGTPACNFVRNGEPFECTGNYLVKQQSDWGIESGHFLVWMRIAGLPRFRKLWGKVDQELKAGTTLRVFYQHNFEVAQFSGRKAFVISTSTALGGRNDFLGYGYMIVGGLCLVFGPGFLWHRLQCGRELGDVSLLCSPQ
jgi:hypothetical protein